MHASADTDVRKHRRGTTLNRNSRTKDAFWK